MVQSIFSWHDGLLFFNRCSNCPGADHAQSEWFVKRFDSTILSFRPGTYDHIVSGWTYTFKLAAVNNEGKLFLFNKNKIGSKKTTNAKSTILRVLRTHIQKVFELGNFIYYILYSKFITIVFKFCVDLPIFCLNFNSNIIHCF